MTYKPKIWHLKLLVFALSFGFYIASLFLPAITHELKVTHSTRINYEIFYGWHILFMGFVNIFFSFFFNGLSWLSNVFLISAWFRMVFELKLTSILSFLALILAPLFLINSNIPVFNITNEHYGGNIIALNIGFYMWIASIAICFLGSVAIQIFETRNKNAQK
jgi:hypothetical protein